MNLPIGTMLLLQDEVATNNITNVKGTVHQDPDAHILDGCEFFKDSHMPGLTFRSG